MGKRTCIYDYCTNEIKDNIHKNRRYCCLEHYSAQKRIRTLEKYYNGSHYKNKKILAQYYTQQEAGIPVTIDILDALGFDWESTDVAFEDDAGNEYYQIDSFCYTILEDSTIFIAKL